MFRIIPDFGVFEFAFDLGQAFILLIVVKDTPSEPARALAYP